MSIVLKTKIASTEAEIGAGETYTSSITSSLASVFTDPEKEICVVLNQLTGEEFEPAGLDVSAPSITELRDLMALPALKLIFPTFSGQTRFIGSLSTAMVARIAQKALEITNDANKPQSNYIPSKLDSLLLRPLTTTLCQVLNTLLGGLEAHTVKTGLSFQDLEFGKTQLSELGPLGHVKICFDLPPADALEPASTAKFKTKPKAKAKASKPDTTKPDTTKDENKPFYVSLFLPQNQLHKLSMQVKTHTGEKAPIIDAEHPWTIHMQDALKMADVTVRAVVESYDMTIAECTRLEIGQVISLPGVSLSSVGLLLNMDIDEGSQLPPVELTQGTLGIFKKNRALRLTRTVDPNFIQNLNLNSL